MEWQHPEVLYWLIPIVLFWIALVLYSESRRKKAREFLLSRSMGAKLLPAPSVFRFWWKQCLRLMAILSGLVALSGPRFGTEIEQVLPRGSDLYVVIDVSRSMLAEDVIPSRLGRAKADVLSLVQRLDGERIGLIAFAGQAVLKCPLTVDYDSFRRSLDELDPSSAPKGGTAIGDAIRKALEVFRTRSDRDQAILLITDGDDQQSYPLEAAATAAEQRVTIFTVGLGDASQGARIPSKNDAQGFVEHEGQQVWSKLDGSLLSEIAVKTSGVYIPAGTKSYDLGQLYSEHLQGKKGTGDAVVQKTRRSEQFQLFLAIAVLALLLDGAIRPFGSTELLKMGTAVHPTKNSGSQKRSLASARRLIIVGTILFWVACSLEGKAEETAHKIREGIRLYRAEDFEKARVQFSEALQEAENKNRSAAAISQFNEGCAYHRQGEFEKAKASYLGAGLSQDKKIATMSHFNLGNLAADQAKRLAGEEPIELPSEKRQEVLDHLMESIAAYRYCLERDPQYPAARRNLELVRQWIKYYSDRWREKDRQKRREESELLPFLEFILESEKGLIVRTTQVEIQPTSDFAYLLKQEQEEIREEIPFLKEKIEQSLQEATANSTTDDASNPTAKGQNVEEGIRLLQGWAEEAAEKMNYASRYLGERDFKKALEQEKKSIDDLERIWGAIVPFRPLLAKDLQGQSELVEKLQDSPTEQKNSAIAEEQSVTKDQVSANPLPDKDPESTSLVLNFDDISKLKDLQETWLRWGKLLAPKAEMELQQLPKNVPESSRSESADSEPAPNTAEVESQKKQVEAIEEGLKKAIELAPQAISRMEESLASLSENKRQEAWKSAEEARRILQEIWDAQPKDPPQENQDPEKDQQQDSSKNDENEKKEDPSEDQNKKDSKQEESNKESSSSEPQKDQASRPPSSNRIEDALRMVREREKEKRDRDRKIQGQILGRGSVEKDW